MFQIAAIIPQVQHVELLLFCLMTGALSMFLQECYKPNMILRKYFIWLMYHWRKKPRKRVKIIYLRINVGDYRAYSKEIRKIKRRHNLKKLKYSLLKPLGLCVYCQNAWITIILYPMLFKVDVWYLLSLGGTFFSVELIRMIKRIKT